MRYTQPLPLWLLEDCLLQCLFLLHSSLQPHSTLSRSLCQISLMSGYPHNQKVSGLPLLDVLGRSIIRFSLSQSSSSQSAHETWFSLSTELLTVLSVNTQAVLRAVYNGVIVLINRRLSNPLVLLGTLPLIISDPRRLLTLRIFLSRPLLKVFDTPNRFKPKLYLLTGIDR